MKGKCKVRTGEALDRINEAFEKDEERITRDVLYYYVRSGFLRPEATRTRRGSIRRYDFSDEDVRLAQIIRRYHAEGISPRIAFEKAMEEKDRPRLL